MLERSEETTDSFLHTASESYAAGQLFDTHRALHRHLAIHGDCGRGWELLGLVYHTWKNWSQAVCALEEASVRVPLTSAAECALAECYLAEDKAGWARSLYLAVLSRKDVTAQVMLSTAAGLDALAEPAHVIEACRLAIILAPDFAKAYFDFSYYLGRYGAPESRVEAAARKAIDLAPDNMTFRIGLAGYLHLRGRSEAAVQLLENLTLDHIQSQTCICCVVRLMDLFETVGDEQRATWCRRRRETLRLANNTTNS